VYCLIDMSCCLIGWVWVNFVTIFMNNPCRYMLHVVLVVKAPQHTKCRQYEKEEQLRIHSTTNITQIARNDSEVRWIDILLQILKHNITS
jgi:hypothetical protein